MGSTSQKVHPWNSAQLAVSSTGEALSSWLQPLSNCLGSCDFGGKICESCFTDCLSLGSFISFLGLLNPPFILCLPICMLLFPFLGMLCCRAPLSYLFDKSDKSIWVALGPQYLFPLGVSCCSLAVQWQPWQEHQAVDELQGASRFPCAWSVQEAGAGAHSPIFCSTCFVGLSIAEETSLWVLWNYSDAMVSDLRDLSDRSKVHLPL